MNCVDVAIVGAGLAGERGNQPHQQGHDVQCHHRLDQPHGKAVAAMAQQIDAMHRAGQRVFAAVGSLHMTGDRGLPAVLGRMGYQVERLP